MPDIGPTQPNRGGPIPPITAGAGGESAGSFSNSLSLLAKVGAAAFGTIIAPILVALVMKHLDPPAPPAAEPTGPKVEAVAALPAAAPASPPAVASNAPPVSGAGAPVPAESSARVKAVKSTSAVSLPSASAKNRRFQAQSRRRRHDSGA